jgi:hypothetical protein
MRTSWTVSLFRHEQPTPQVWAELEQVVSAWNDESGPRFDTTVDYARYARFDENEDGALERLLARLDAVDAAAMHVVRRDMVEDSDYGTAEYVGVLGAAVDGVVLNEAAALIATGPCPGCGELDGLDVAQVRPFVVDETRLPDDVAVDLAGGAIAMSTRQVAAWHDAGLSGADFLEILDGSTGRASTSARQLSARLTILTPCPEHTLVVGPPHCPECGRAMGQVEGYFWVRSDEVDGADVVSRHRGGRTALYLSRRALETLRAAGPTGLDFYDVMRLCGHG